jgi:hypothetical protein
MTVARQRFGKNVPGATDIIRSERKARDGRLVNSGQARLFNNTLYVQYVRLTKGQAYSQRDKPIISSDRMLHKDYDRKGSAAKKISGREPQETFF